MQQFWGSQHGKTTNRGVGRTATDAACSIDQISLSHGSAAIPLRDLGALKDGDTTLPFHLAPVLVELVSRRLDGSCSTFVDACPESSPSLGPRASSSSYNTNSLVGPANIDSGILFSREAYGDKTTG